MFFLAGGFAVAGFFLLVGGISLLAGQALRTHSLTIAGMLAFLAVLGLTPFSRFLKKTFEPLVRKNQSIFQIQKDLGCELARSSDLNQISTALQRAVDKAAAPESSHIYILDSRNGHYIALFNESGRPSSDIRFAASSRIVQSLAQKNHAVHLSDLLEMTELSKGERARLHLLNADLFIPLQGADRLAGWIAAGKRKSGEPYHGQCLQVLESISDQAALAVERAQFAFDADRYARELNVLTRVAQGVSFTMTFDDVLEMLATQASHVLPAKNFRIYLLDAETGAIRNVFYLENDERLKENENRAIPTGQGLEREVITTQRWMVTDDYERECRRRSLIPLTKGIFSWMGVPLNAGEATIGVISVSSRDPGIIFTEDHRSMLQAIADQASGAILKARSLAEFEKRARQLAKLNEISLSLNSTLEAGALANQALSGASELIGTEAGYLFTIDPQSDELILEAACGKIKTGQLGERLPADTRIAYDALRTGQVVIENDTKERVDWLDQNDGCTKPQALNLIQVPMRIQDRMIGVIELINKEDGSPFSSSDQELLTAFISQATIAMENARLYTLTDQALAARVEELSVMQRIDHELNDSLDIERAMRLTLKWAMRQSGAEGRSGRRLGRACCSGDGFPGI